MIYGEHEIGGLRIFPPSDPDFTGGGRPLMVIRQDDVDMTGVAIWVRDALDRSDVERLRDLCDEALS